MTHMLNRLHVTTIVGLVAALWAAVLFFSGVDVSASWFKPLNGIAFAVFLLVSLFNNVLWRWPILHGWFVKRPDLRGTWRVTLTPRNDPDNPILAYMAIRQTYSSLTMRLMTDESTSELLGSDVLVSRDDIYEVVGFYRNEPRSTVRERSPIHQGAIRLRVNGPRPLVIEGEYWTDRGTQGEIRLEDRQKELFDRFADATHR